MDQAAERRLLLDPALALGELYMEGCLVVTRGCLYDLLALLSSNISWRNPPGLARAQERIRRTLRPLQQRNTRPRAARNVNHRYDLGGRLYDLFLDADRQYSCAYFEHPDQTLEDAQLAKKRHIASKMALEEGHRVLDIGCGWGGLALYFARHCRVRVLGVTLSEEQLAVARHRAHESGSHADFRLQDYRATTERFDRIVSMRHVRACRSRLLPLLLWQSSRASHRSWRYALHSIGLMDGPGAANPWMDKYIFPGSYAPALSEYFPPSNVQV